MSQPPCEAVSWNIFLQLFQLCSFRSASLWGCELKYGTDNYNCKSSDVSLLVRLWVEISKTVDVFGCCLVSLLVRLWVEIYFRLCSWLCDNWSASLWGCELKCPPRTYTKQTCVSASLWGCELKYQEHHTSFAMTTVSLLVRLWVEIPLKWTWLIRNYPSASLWGCELK